MKKKLISLLMTILLLFYALPVRAEEPLDLTAVSAVLMEPTTGTILYEKNGDQQLYPASITKIMTLILIYDALESGKIGKEDIVTVSEYAASMGGSQVFLEAGEQQSVETMIKCISVASANDACVAMAELVCGSETAFVEKMNQRAENLGMKQTHFVNCCGLDTEGHVTSARDVALMSRELITRYPDIFQYTGIWMENITHKTARGSSEFGLTNTNKMIRQYPYATGLKTGSTGLAKYCVSATASKDGIDLIAVIMAAADYKIRFREAAALLDYGFANCRLYRPEPLPMPDSIRVEGGKQEQVTVKSGTAFSWLCMDDTDFSQIRAELELPDTIEAPIRENDVVGRIVYSLNGKELGIWEILAAEDVDRASFFDVLSRMADSFLTLKKT